jgi:hypothetical protein
MEHINGHAPLPSVVTPRHQLKRKHGEIVDLTGADNATHSATTCAKDNVLTASKAHNPVISTQDSEGEQVSESASIYEDILDTIELEPYAPICMDKYEPLRLQMLTQSQ